MASEVRQTNEICKQMTAKKLICFNDKLRFAPPERYAQLHSKGELVNGKKQLPSLIGVSIMDYSSGKGNATKIVSFNLAPEECQFLLTRIEAGFQEYDWSSQKIYGNPDPSKGNTCPAESFRISRHVKDGRGQMLASPWQIAISNGRGIKLENRNGGFYMQGGSYREEGSCSINLTDLDLYKLLKRVDSFIDTWEHSAEAYRLMQDGKAGFDRMLASRQQPQGAYQQPPAGYPQAAPQGGMPMSGQPQMQPAYPQQPPQGIIYAPGSYAPVQPGFQS